MGFSYAAAVGALASLLAAGGWAGDLGDFIFTQVPVRAVSDRDGARLVRLSAGEIRVLTPTFHTAADPEVSFDGQRVLFAGRRSAREPFNVFEMNADGSGVRQITQCAVDCRSPIYQSRIFYLDDSDPMAQIAFTGEDRALYSARMDGSGVRRLTYNPDGSFHPAMLPDGRMVFTSGRADRMALFGINLDGTDYATFTGNQGRTPLRMACVTKDRVVFVESSAASHDGSGSLAAVSLRRNLHSYRRLSTPADGQFHSPSSGPDGSVLAAWRAAGAAGNHGIYRLDLATGRKARIYDSPDHHDVQPKLVRPRTEPDGRSSVVDEKENWSKLYSLNVYDSDLAREVWPRGMVKRVRLVEQAGSGTRLIGEVAVDEDGSFNVRIPANVTFMVQALDEAGMVLRSSAWIWTKNKEQRGCIGCHEDGERTPENILATALTRPSADLVLPAAQRRHVDYARDIAPILQSRCANAACHTTAELHRSVTPGSARTSRLVWALFGKNTSRPWDGSASGRPPQPMPPPGAPPLTDSEKRSLIEWIDMGANGVASAKQGARR